jgi:hypothetical protein
MIPEVTKLTTHAKARAWLMSAVPDNDRASIAEEFRDGPIPDSSFWISGGRKLTGRHFETGQKFNVALLASGTALADAILFL